MTRDPFVFGRVTVPPGRRKDIRLLSGETMIASPLYVPVSILHGTRPGPTLFVCAALHGDELNGVEIVRQIRDSVRPEELGGTVILVMIGNPLSFLLQKRDLPDGKDLNRAFPGRKNGSIGAALAHAIFHKIVLRSDYGIDLHTAGHGRINLPYVRGNLAAKGVQELVDAFAPEIVVDDAPERGTMRWAAQRRGVPVITYEAGEPLRFENAVIERGVRCIRNALAAFGMVEGEPVPPPFQIVAKERRWLRAKRGGILIVHVRPGDIVRRRDVVAHTSRPYGTERVEIRAPFDGIVISTATIPTVVPGGAVCHIVRLSPERLAYVREVMQRPVLP